MGRKNKNLVAAAATAAVPVIADLAMTQGKRMIQRIKARRSSKRAKGELPLQRMRRRREQRRQQSAGDPVLSSSMVNPAGARVSTVPGSAMIPRPVTYNNRKGKWLAGTNGPRIRKCEFIGMITGSTLFTAQTLNGYTDGRFILNPGLEYSFPWLSAIAANFESYKFHSLAVRYVPTTNLNATGNLYMLPVIDPLQTLPPPSRETFSEFGDVVDTNVKESAVCYFPLGAKTEPYRWRYIRNALADNIDLVSKDLGYFVFGRGGCADTSDQGELWIEYDVELFNPRFRDALTRTEGGKITGVAPFSVSNLLGTNATVDTRAVGISVSAGVVTLQNSAYWLLAMQTSGASGPFGFNVLTGSLNTLQLAQEFSTTVVTVFRLSNTGETSFTITASGGTPTACSTWFATCPNLSLALEVDPPSMEEMIKELKADMESLKLSKYGRFIEIPK